MARPKTVLVTIGESKKPVKFSGSKQALIGAIRDKFDLTSEAVSLQIWDKDFGDYRDLKEGYEIPDKSKITVQYRPQAVQYRPKTQKVSVKFEAEGKEVDVEFCGSYQDLITAITDKFGLTSDRIALVQRWDMDFDSYIDLEDGDEIPDKSKINVVLLMEKQASVKIEDTVKFSGSYRDLIGTIGDKFGLAREAISHLQIWNDEFDSYLDLEDREDIPDSSKINVVLKEIPVFGQPPMVSDSAAGTSTPGLAQAASIGTDKIWKGKEVLKVYFLNPNDITRWNWKSGGEPLTPDDIMDWAFFAWRGDKIPKLKRTEVKEKADIRVEFTESGGCWSMLGMDARSVKDLTKPTMSLNLRLYSKDEQKSLVIHQFGHVLGLEHEHQRSDFWDVIEKFIDKDKMVYDFEGRGFKSSTLRAECEQRTNRMKREYDPDSIMHYWMDIEWLKDERYKEYQFIDQSGLSEKKKNVLRGIHKRSKYHLVTLPSKMDIKCLEEAYGGMVEELTTKPPASGGKLTIETLKKETRVTDGQLDSEVEERDLREVAKCFSSVDFNYLDRMGLSEIQQSDLNRISSKHGERVAMSKALEVWRYLDPRAATFRALIHIFLDYQDDQAARKLCTYLLDKPLTIETLKAETGVTDGQLYSELNNQDFYHVASFFDEVDPIILSAMGLSEPEKVDVMDIGRIRGVQPAMYRALGMWHNRNPFMATFRALIDIFLKYEDDDAARKLCEYTCRRRGATDLGL